MVLVPANNMERVDSGASSVTANTDGMISREVSLRWLIHSVETYTDAEQKGRELAPLYYDGHRRVSLTPRSVGNGWYEIEAVYGNAGVNAYEGREFINEDGVPMVPAGLSMDTTGGKETVTIAYQGEEDVNPIATGYAENPAIAPNSYGAINVSGGRVNGVEITVPSLSWSETWLVPAWYLVTGSKEPAIRENAQVEDADDPSQPYAQVLHEMGGMVNEDRFRIFGPGEVLFLGARFDVNTSSTMVPVTYSFVAQRSRNEFKVGDITVTKKAGMDFLWIVYGDEVDQNFPVKKPRYVYVDQVYPRKKFLDLKLPGGRWWPRFYLSGGNTFEHPISDEKKNKA
jgi:hypothetical protein